MFNNNLTFQQVMKRVLKWVLFKALLWCFNVDPAF